MDQSVSDMTMNSSKDHDFEPGFIMWLKDEDYEAINFKLFREYEKLPKEFMGIKRQATSFFGTGKYGGQNHW